MMLCEKIIEDTPAYYWYCANRNLQERG